MKITIEIMSKEEAVEASEAMKAFVCGMGAIGKTERVITGGGKVSKVVIGDIMKSNSPGEQKPTSSTTTKTEQTSSNSEKKDNTSMVKLKMGAEKPGESETSEEFSDGSLEPSSKKPASKEKVSEKKQRRTIAMQKADELGIEYGTKMGTAAIEKMVAKAEETPLKKEDDGGDDMIPGTDSKAGKKAGKKASKKKMYKAKDVKELCYRYIQDNPVQGDTDEKKTALYGDILEKYGEAKKMSEIEANGNLQIVGEVLAAHIAYWDVVTAVSEHAATSAVVLITNQEDLTEIPPMLHVPVLEALLTVLVAVDEKDQ